MFIRRPDCIDLDPMGRRTVRTMMHPGYQNPQYIGPCGPSDPEVSVLAVQGIDGKPMTLVANYSMHYFGAAAISADYYGDFVRIVSERVAPGLGRKDHGPDERPRPALAPRSSCPRSHAPLRPPATGPRGCRLSQNGPELSQKTAPSCFRLARPAGRLERYGRKEGS